MTWIQTYSGLRFDLTDPRPDQVCLEDIAHSLAMVYRFGGHCREFYSVAQHSVHVAEYIGEAAISVDATTATRNTVMALALLHDAHEAYIGDVVQPMKLIVDLRGIDEKIQAAVHEHFWLVPEPWHLAAIKRADRTALATEVRDLMGPPPEPWVEMPPPWLMGINTWSWQKAQETFFGLARSIGLQG